MAEIYLLCPEDYDEHEDEEGLQCQGDGAGYANGGIVGEPDEEG